MANHPPISAICWAGCQKARCFASQRTLPRDQKKLRLRCRCLKRNSAIKWHLQFCKWLQGRQVAGKPWPTMPPARANLTVLSFCIFRPPGLAPACGACFCALYGVLSAQSLRDLRVSGWCSVISSICVDYLRKDISDTPGRRRNDFALLFVGTDMVALAEGRGEVRLPAYLPRPTIGRMMKMESCSSKNCTKQQQTSRWCSCCCIWPALAGQASPSGESCPGDDHWWEETTGHFIICLWRRRAQPIDATPSNCAKCRGVIMERNARTWFTPKRPRQITVRPQ